MVDINFRENDVTQTAGPDSPLPVRFRADAALGLMQYVSLTLSATPEEVTSIEIPVWATGVRIRPSGAAVRFALGEDPATPVPVVGAAALLADLQAGGFAYGDTNEVRQLESGEGRELRLRSATASVAVIVEFF